MQYIACSVLLIELNKSKSGVINDEDDEAMELDDGPEHIKGHLARLSAYLDRLHEHSDALQVSLRTS